MRYLALVCDFDGTLAHDSKVDDETVAALQRVRDSGRRLVMVTGRELEDLINVFPRLDLFERVVAENGALLYRPSSQEEQPLGEPPAEQFVRALRERGVDPLSVGRVIVATWHPNESTVLELIRDLGIERQVIFNKGAVMVLPSGVNKASGLQVALGELGLSPHNAVGVGDAENDHAFLSLCECSVAVANALPMLKERADLVTSGRHGAGVVELVEKLIADDLRELEPRLTRHEILLGTRDGGEAVRVKPYGGSFLIAGPSGSGKSNVATGFLERLVDHGYQFCIIDPEGDYETLEAGVVLGDTQRKPRVEEVLELLEKPDQNVVVNLLGYKLEDRPSFFESLLPRLQEFKAQTGRPHWIFVDEAHHMLPAGWGPASLTLPQRLDGMVLISVHPDHIAAAALEPVETIVAVGESPQQTISAYSEVLGKPPPKLAPVTLKAGEALAWFKSAPSEGLRFRTEAGKSERRRHLRKYAEGDLGPHSFYFRGPEGKLNLQAQNLMVFMQIADGLDDPTWLHHLRQGDYSGWFRETIKDDGLADEAARVEQQTDLSPRDSRARIRDAIERRYTAPV
jgi:HAD superfamily hydrolase (TIGR01484 family)